MINNITKLNTIITCILSVVIVNASEDRANFFYAIGHIESGNDDEATGDYIGNIPRARGRYQIWRSYWQDAVESEECLQGGSWHDVHNEHYAMQIVGAYMRRWEPTAWHNEDWESLSKLHHLGPRWRDSPQKGEAYWQRVKKILYRDR